MCQERSCRGPWGALSVDEWAVHAIQGMYHNARSSVRVNGQYSEKFGVGVGVHQGTVLSPLLFILVLEALLRKFCNGAWWELPYADDPVLIVDTQEECISKLKAWKAGMEVKVSGVGLDVLKKSGKYLPVLSAARVSATTPSSCSTSCGSTRSAVASLVDWWPMRASSAPGVRVSVHWRQTNDSGGFWRYQAWCGGHFLLSGWDAVFRWGLWQFHCCQILCGLGKVQETITRPHLQAPLF